MDTVVAVVVTYNPEIADTLAQMKALLRDDIRVVYVDNASSNRDDLTRELSQFDERCFRLIVEPENIGLAAAQNRGIDEAAKMSATHVIFFDQDSVPVPGFVPELLMAERNLVEKGENVSAVGPAAYDPVSGKDYAITEYFGPFIKRKYPSGNDPIEATFVISSGSLVRMLLLKEVGSMRADFFIDYIDVEWCLRARSLGHKCFVAPRARMSHRIGDNRVRFLGRTISAHSPLRRYYLIRNSFLMLRLKYVPLTYKLREIALNAARVCVFLAISSDKRAYMKMMRRAVSDGFAGKFGKYQERSNHAAHA